MNVRHPNVNLQTLLPVKFTTNLRAGFETPSPPSNGPEIHHTRCCLARPVTFHRITPGQVMPFSSSSPTGRIGLYLYEIALNSLFDVMRGYPLRYPLLLHYLEQCTLSDTGSIAENSNDSLHTAVLFDFFTTSIPSIGMTRLLVVNEGSSSHTHSTAIDGQETHATFVRHDPSGIRPVIDESGSSGSFLPLLLLCSAGMGDEENCINLSLNFYLIDGHAQISYSLVFVLADACHPSDASKRVNGPHLDLAI